MDDSRHTAFAGLRLILVSLVLAVVWVLASWVMASDSASADENDSLLGGVVGGVVSTVDAPLGAVTESTGSVVSTVVDTVTVLTPQPVDRIVTSLVGTVDAVVDAQPVTAIVTPVAAIVDPLVGAVPVVSDVLGSTPITDAVTPVTTIVETSLGNVTGTPAVALPSVPPLPPLVAPPPDSSAIPADTAGIPPASVAVAELAGPTATEVSAVAPMSVARWAASLPATTPSEASMAAVESPSRAPNLLAPFPGALDPVAPGASGSASSSGGPAGAGFVAIPAGSETAVLLSGVLRGRAGDDSTPSSPARELSSTPD